MSKTRKTAIGLPFLWPIQAAADMAQTELDLFTKGLKFVDEEIKLHGGGRMLRKTMLRGWKNMNPTEHYFAEHVDLYEHIDDPAYLAKKETFERWYENPVNLPGRWYLQAIVQLFKENRLAKGGIRWLGQTPEPEGYPMPRLSAGRRKR